MKITSRTNPRIKELVRLRDRRPRDELGKFLIEGYRPLRRALDNGYPIEELYICPEFYLGENNAALVADAAAAGAAVVELEAPVFRKIAYRDRPEGLLGLAPQRRRDLNDPAAAGDFFILAEAIEKPGNLGTMLRSADAAGVDALVLCDPCTDIFNPNVVRASIGTLFTVPVLAAGADAAVAWCRARGIALVAATPHTDTVYTDVDLTGPVAVAMGTEQVGLSDTLMAAADVQVRIPMLGQADSLNVATATTLLLYEVRRQRGWPATAVLRDRNCQGMPRAYPDCR